MNTISFSIALLMGLTGSLHCAGMCGPIVWVMPFNMLTGFRKWIAIGMYHFGRISIYALLAVILHSFKAFFNPQWQQYISIALGVSLLLAGLLSFLPNKAIIIPLPWSNQVKKQLAKFIGNPSFSSLLISGMLNGLLPCGLVYMALAATVSSPTPLQAAMLMYVFGLGTMPVLVSISVLKTRARFLHDQYVKKMVPVFMFAFGSLFVLRGMNLGIPYLSPKVVVEHSVVKASCCHKD